jgi:hypothetical protein
MGFTMMVPPREFAEYGPFTFISWTDNLAKA